MTCGTMAVTLLFALAAMSVCVYLPEGSESVPVVGSRLVSQDSTEVAAVSEDTLEMQEDTVLSSIKEENLDFMADAAETNVGAGLDFASYEPVNDTVLSLYRNQDTRGYVEWFYTHVTGSREVALAILDAASEFNVSPSLAFALAYTESRFKTNANHTNVNGSIDRGLFQLNSYSFPNLSEEEFYDAATSAYYGMSHLNYCLEAAGSDSLIAGLAMYNAGRNKVDKIGTSRATLDYISKILDYQKKLDSSFSTEIMAFYSDGNGSSSDRYLAKY